MEKVLPMKTEFETGIFVLLKNLLKGNSATLAIIYKQTPSFENDNDFVLSLTIV